MIMALGTGTLKPPSFGPILPDPQIHFFDIFVGTPLSAAKQIQKADKQLHTDGQADRRTGS